MQAITQPKVLQVEVAQILHSQKATQKATHAVTQFDLKLIL